MSNHGFKFNQDNRLPNFKDEIRNFPSGSDEKHSTMVEPETMYEERIYYVCINSSDRNVTSYPKVNEYKIDFEDTFKNVTSIEIVNATVANKASVLSNPYLVVRVEGLNHLNFSNNNINKGFALLYLKNTTGAHVQPELGVLQRNTRVFRTPLATLNSLRVSIVTPDGVLFDFGEADGNIATEFQNSFVFKIVTTEISRKPLQQRNLF